MVHAYLDSGHGFALCIHDPAADDMVFDQAQLERPCGVQPVDADEIDAGARRAGCEEMALRRLPGNLDGEAAIGCRGAQVHGPGGFAHQEESGPGQRLALRIQDPAGELHRRLSCTPLLGRLGRVGPGLH